MVRPFAQASRCRRICLAGCVLVSLPFLRVSGQGQLVVRGTIIGQDSIPVSGVEVRVSSAGELRVATTSSSGKYLALISAPVAAGFGSAAPSVFIIVRKPGFEPKAWRAEVQGTSPVLVADAVIRVAPVGLPPLWATASTIAKSPVQREIGGSGQVSARINELLLADPGDLSAMLAALAGVFASDSGVSLLGASASQNTMTIDGLPSSAGSLPPDALGLGVGVGYSVTAADPSRGGFSGANVSITSARGSNGFASTLRGAFTAPALSWRDPAAPQKPFLQVPLSGYISGPIKRGSAFYRLSFTNTMSSSATTSLLHPEPKQLAQIGLTMGTVALVSSTLASLGVPTRGIGVTPTRSSASGSLYLRVDAQSGATGLLTFTAYPNWNRSRSPSGGTLSFPATVLTTANDGLRLGLNRTGYLAGLIDEIRVGVSFTRMNRTPDADLPGGTVSVGTEFESGKTGLTTLQFGGNSFYSRSRETQVNVFHQQSWLSPKGVHELRLAQEIGWRSQREVSGNNLAGRYSYPSIAALQLNRPSLLTRTLDTTINAYHAVSPALFATDVWRANGHLTLQGGFRVDLATAGPVPGYNPAVEAAFGRRTDHVPIDFGISPRIGFAWVVSDRTHQGVMVRRPGSNMVIPGGNLTPADVRSPSGNSYVGLTLTGNFGAYRGTVTPSQLGTIGRSTGLANNPSVLTCVSDAVPAPDWASFGAPPVTCQDGSGTTTFSSLHPVIRLFDPKFSAPVSWRQSLGLGGLWLRNWRMQLSAVGSLNTHQTSQIDLNFRERVGFHLDSEGNRPVYVTPDEIDPASGSVAPGANRMNPAFGSVWSMSSDLKSRAFQLNIEGRTETFFGNFPLAVGYSLNLQSAQSRGQGESPSEVTWVSGAQPIHQFTFTSQGYRLWWFTMGARFTLRSGQAFTPLVAGDVNGDGRGLDPAFVRNPATTTDVNLAEQFSSLLGSAPSWATSCLRKQFDQVATVNSCRSGWQSQIDFAFSFDPPPQAVLSEKLHFSMKFLNAGGALVRLLGLTNTTLGYSPGSPDPYLLYVTGFDPVAQAYRYRVNQNFAQSSTPGSSHRFPPFQLQLGAEYVFGGKAPKTLTGEIAKLSIGEPDVARSLVAVDLRTRFAPDPIAPLLFLRDSLALTSEQSDELGRLQRSFVVAADSALQPVVDLVMRMGRGLSETQLLNATNAVIPTIVQVILSVRAQAEAQLTEEQRWMIRRKQP